MNTRQDRIADPNEGAAHDLAARIDALFRRFPMLAGFSVQAGERLTRERAVGHLGDDLYLADLACHPALDVENAALLSEEITRALLELVDEQPEALGLLPGRTFARTVH